MEKQTVLTQERYKELSEELESLRTVGRDDIAEKIRVARSFGDLSENAEYNEAMDEQAKLEARIAKLEEDLRNVSILDEDAISTDAVSPGCKVTLRDLEFDETVQYKILGRGDIDNGIISDQSPMGMALIGKQMGEVAEFQAPGASGKMLRFEVLEISK